MKLLLLLSSSSSTQPPVQWVLGAVSTVIKLPGREDDRSAPSSSEVKNDGTIPSLSHTPAWRGV
jgi:hypothetical protein